MANIKARAPRGRTQLQGSRRNEWLRKYQYAMNCAPQRLADQVHFGLRPITCAAIAHIHKPALWLAFNSFASISKICSLSYMVLPRALQDRARLSMRIHSVGARISPTLFGTARPANIAMCRPYLSRGRIGGNAQYRVLCLVPLHFHGLRWPLLCHPNRCVWPLQTSAMLDVDSNDASFSGCQCKQRKRKGRWGHRGGQADVCLHSPSPTNAYTPPATTHTPTKSGSFPSRFRTRVARKPTLPLLASLPNCACIWT